MSGTFGGSAECGGDTVVAKYQARFSATASIAAILISFAVSSFAESRTTRLNENAFAYAQELISQGHVVLDKKNDWGHHRAAAQQENDFIRDHGFAGYSNWHLGINPTHVQKSKARFKFPFGDFKNVHRCALLAVKSRAHQYGYSDIENAAKRLLEMVDVALWNSIDGQKPVGWVRHRWSSDHPESHALKNASINIGSSAL